MKQVLCLFLFMSLTIVAFCYTEKPTATLSKSLAFPVAGKKSHIGSFWGDERDGGKRQHRGIDIFARKGTAVVALCDGFIVSKGNGGRGGKYLWVQSVAHPWSAYYAHLDEQKVTSGQLVKKGEVIGTVGNTGNARTTPSHLHFGIYTVRGAVNPLPYLKYSTKIMQGKVPKKKLGLSVVVTKDKSKNSKASGNRKTT